MLSNLLIPSTISIGFLNLFTPFVTVEDSKLRKFLLLMVSIFFLGNICIIDYLFLDNIEFKIIFFAFGKYEFSFHTEIVGLIFLNLLAVLWICALIYTSSFLKINKIARSSQFLFFLNLCILCGCIVALSANLFTMFIGYEALTLSTIPLIAHINNVNMRAGLYNYLKILMGTSLILLFPAIMLIYVKIGHGNFTDEGIIANIFTDEYAILLLLLFIFGISKGAVVPFFGWLPSAMVASYPVSALLHAVVVVKTGLCCIYKILIYIFGLEYLKSLMSQYSYNWFLLLPAITIIYISFKALREKNIKMILAYSTITQLNIALLGAFMFTPKALAAAILHMISHAFAKICLFYGAGNFYSLYATYEINDLNGISKQMPKTSLIFFVAILSLIGFPPLAGFVSKFHIMLAASEQENIFVMIILIISSVLSAIYMGKLLMHIYQPKRIALQGPTELKLPKSMILPLAFCIVILFSFYQIQKIILNKFLYFI